jgi:DedD protein
MLVGIGCLGVLGLTFGVGFYAGRYSTRASLPAAALEPGAGSGAVPARRGASAAPALTFYEELTAPLPTPPPAAKVAAAEPRRAVEKPDGASPRPDERAARSDKRGADTPARRSEPAAAGPRFTVQIAAYSARASAEALRSTVSASGHEAYIVESDAPPGAPRYRVRVGSYPTREAAIAAASRLPGVGARYVTSR